MIMAIDRKIWVTFNKRGLHRYPAAEYEYKLEDVKYLANEHHHFFEFKVGISVEHNDRDIEFHQFLKWCEAQFDRGEINIDYKSCEMLAEELIAKIAARWPDRAIWCDVSEDGYVGAELYYRPA